MLTKKNCLPFAMWFFPLAFFAFQFILRLWPGLMMQEIMKQFSIDAASFGLLAAFYYYGYAGMQIPMALLLERFGPRVIIFSFAVLCGLGTLLFTSTHQFYLALLSRFLIGAGSAVGFLGISKVVSEWFNPNLYPKLIGFSFSIGLLGAVYGGKPITHWISSYGGEQVGIILSFVSLGIGLATFMVLRSPKQKSTSQEKKMEWTHFSVLKTSKALWILALANFLMVGALEGFADVWGVAFLMNAYHFAKEEAAFLISFIFIGMLFGGPILAYFSKKWGNYKVIGACGLGLVFIFVLLLSNSLNHWWLFSLAFFSIGILCCYQVVIFAAGAHLVNPGQLSVAIAFLNCINMLGGSFFHTTIGKIMDLYWNGSLNADGLRIYPLTAFEHALALIPLSALVGSFLVYLLYAHGKKTPKEILIQKALKE